MLSDYIHWGGFSLLPQLFSPQQDREFLSFVSPSVGKNQLSKYVNKDLCMKGIRPPRKTPIHGNRKSENKNDSQN